MLAFCEDCDVLLCRQCVPEHEARKCTLRYMHEKAPMVKTFLHQGDLKEDNHFFIACFSLIRLEDQEKCVR